MKLLFTSTLLSALLLPSFIVSETNAIKDPEKWWDYSCRDKNIMEQFISWQGNENAISRILCRLHIINKKYKSVLDIPCGLCVDYKPLKRSCSDLEYLGIDISPLFISRVQEQGIPALVGKIQEIPCQDSSFDVVYSRYILEHLGSYQKAVQELVRVARKEVIIVFFSGPDGSLDDRLTTMELHGNLLNQNRYSKPKLELFLKSMPKVKSFSWQEVKNKDECILHILL